LLKRSFYLVLGLLVSTSALATPKVYIFDCGTIGLADVSSFGLTNAETDVRELFVPCYVIEQDGKRLLWDAGLPLAMVGSVAQEGDGGMIITYEKSLLDQLGKMQLTPADIDFTSYSHFHFDHVGAANAFPTSTLLINSKEYEAAFLHAEDNPVFDPSLYNKLLDTPRVLLDGEHDVFGDGSVLIIPAPGHTPGHQVLLIQLEKTGPIMLSGDLYHFEFSRLMRRTPVFNTDKGQTLESMTAIEARLESSGAKLWIEHSKALADSLKMAPFFYD